MKQTPTFFELYSRALDKYKDEVVIEDPSGSYTMSRVEIYASRINAYLRSQEIECEDRVLIVLPRGFKTLVAILGVLKAGATFIPLEEGYPEERIRYIKNDCDPKIVIDNLMFDRMVNVESLPSRTETDVHDLAFILYTSGSTGNPKGVMHEYGDLNYMVETYAIEAALEEPDLSYEEYIDKYHSENRPCCASPSFFIAGITYYLDVLITGDYHYFMSPDDFNDPEKFKKIMEEKQLTSVFLTPSYLKTFDDIKTPYLKEVYVGAERVTEIYDSDVKFVNCYGMTESLCTVTYFYIDKEYESTPIGTAYKNLQLHLIGEDGKEAEKGNMGEIIIYNPYFRGYYNLPEQTAKVRKGNWYYTGDLARELPNGNLVIFGRKDDMIKVNGNRIEPGEVETAIKELLHIEWAHVQPFQVRNKTFICAYYLDNIEFDSDELRESLSKMLPAYMIPNFYVKIDEVPTLPSGKIDRMAFSAPEIDRLRTEYVAPVTETEKMICEKLEELLDVNPVGIKDDFVMLGGDSLSAMELVSECNLPGFDVAHVLRCKTVENIAKRYDEIKAKNSRSLDEREAEDRAQSWHVLPHQFMFLKQQEFNPESSEYNISFLLCFTKYTNAQKMKNAVEKTIRNHPALFTTFYNDNGSIKQKYDPSIEKDLKVERITDEKMMQIKDTLPKPFIVDSSRLYECRIFKSMKHVYVFFDVHHSIFDGVSMGIFIDNIIKAYKGEKLEPDYYYVFLEDYRDSLESDDIREAKKFYDNKYSAFDIPRLSKKHLSDTGYEENLYSDVKVNRRKLELATKSLECTPSELYMGAVGLAIAMVAKQSRFGFGWTYSGRDSVIKKNSCSCYINQLVTYINIEKTPTIESYFKDLKQQIKDNIENVLYPYAFTILPRYQGALTYIYQGDLFEIDPNASYEYIPIENKKTASDSFLQFSLFDNAEGLTILLNYNTAFFDGDLVNEIIFSFGSALRRIVDGNTFAKLPLKDFIVNSRETGNDTAK